MSSIFYPHNGARKIRLIEMATDTQSFLYEALNDYVEFKSLTAQVNEQIMTAYDKAGLQPPSTKQVDIIKAEDIGNSISSEENTVKIIEIIVDIPGVLGSIKYLTPACTRALVKAGALTIDQAERVLIRFSAAVLGEVEVTLGDVAGGILGGILGGVAVAAVDLGITAIAEKVEMDQLRKGLHAIQPLRVSTKLSLMRAKTLLDSIKQVKTTLDALTDESGKPILPAESWDQTIKNLIAKDVQPAVNAESAITESTVMIELNNFDLARHSWTAEDIH
jgi:hypothetical protein